MKRCSTCKEFKELICFSKNKSRSDGFSITCKQCSAENNRKYRQEKAARLTERHRKYHPLFIKAMNEITKQYG